MLRQVLPLLLLLLAATLPAQDTAPRPIIGGPQDQVVVTPDRNDAEIGDPIQLRLSFPSNEEYRTLAITLPKEQDGLALVEPPKFDGKTWTATLRLLKDGELAVGPLTLKATTHDGVAREYKSLALAFNVPELAPTSEPVRDFTPPARMEFDWTWRNVALVAGVILLIGLVALVSWLMGRRKLVAPVVPITPPVPPIDEALAAVGSLRSLRIFDVSGAEAHYTALSQLLRRYFERQYEVPALEMTEDEIAQFVRRNLAARGGVGSLAAIITRTSDAKYARSAVDRGLADEDTRDVQSFLEAEHSRIEAERRAAAIATNARTAGAAAS